MTNEIMKNEMVNTSGETWKEKFFTTTGTIGRMTFFKRSLILLGAELLLLLVVSFPAILSSVFLGLDESMLADVIVAVVLLAALFPDYCLNVKRLRDIGKDETLAKIFVGVGILSIACNFAAEGTIAYTVANVLAIVSLIFTVYLLFKKGVN